MSEREVREQYSKLKKRESDITLKELHLKKREDDISKREEALKERELKA